MTFVVVLELAVPPDPNEIQAASASLLDFPGTIRHLHQVFCLYAPPLLDNYFHNFH